MDYFVHIYSINNKVLLVKYACDQLLVITSVTVMVKSPIIWGGCLLIDSFSVLSYRLQIVTVGQTGVCVNRTVLEI